jgi:signal transduction histidine kinase
VSEPLRILIAEDEPADAELLVRELQRSGYAVEWRRVDQEAAFLKELADPPDMIISDNAMPSFSAARALEVLKERGLCLPFIVVSRAIGEEQAVALMRDGANDYVMKDRLWRIGGAVKHVREEARLRQANAESQAALHRLNHELEERIAQRTRELQAANETLGRELSDRRRAEDELRRLTNELETRVAARTADLLHSQARLRALASELVLTEQRERRQLATDLHDYLAQLLVLGRLKLTQAASKPMERDAGELILQTQEVLKQALTYTRTLVADLSPPVLREFGLPAALQWLAEHMGPHGLSVTVEIAKDCPILPEDEAVLLFQSVRELLMNVSKHAGVAQASVTLSIPRQDCLQIIVADGGKGFDPTAVDRPTEQFGLFSIRERMQVMGGILEIESSPGHGTTAKLTLPISPKATEAPPTGLAGAPIEQGPQDESPGVTPEAGRTMGRAARPSFQQTAKVRVLLADDHAMVRQGLRNVLESYQDLQVIGEARDGMEAIELAQTLKPDVIVMDVNMPRLDGVAATSRVKLEQPATTVIGLSVNGARQVAEAMRQAGASAFLTKDSVADQLYQAIQRTRSHSLL